MDFSSYKLEMHEYICTDNVASICVSMLVVHVTMHESLNGATSVRPTHPSSGVGVFVSTSLFLNQDE